VFIPLRDINPTRRAPVLTYALIALNLAVFVFQAFVLSAGQNDLFVQKHAVIPYYLLSGYGPSLSTPFTSMFMHGGLMHVAFNMWFLHVFGDNVEDTLGHARYLALYFFTGVVAVVAHSLTDPMSQQPLVGASGAISGVLGAYIMLHPHARVVTWALVIFVVELPAFVFLIVWFGTQLVSGFNSLGGIEPSGVAFFAHVGGFVAGVLFVLLSGKPTPAPYLGPRWSAREMRRRF
jgi:membrane associated rhomboid family serine protease